MFCLQKFRWFILGYHFVIRTDNQALFSEGFQAAKRARCVSFLQQFYCDIDLLRKIIMYSPKFRDFTAYMQLLLK